MWFIVDDDEMWSSERGYADCKIQYGPFGTKAEAEEFRADPANAYDELGRVVELVWALSFERDGKLAPAGLFGEKRLAHERIVADALAGRGMVHAVIAVHEVRS